MVGGRPPKGDQQRHPELEELADWFAHAVEKAGYRSLNAVVAAELAPKRVVYDISNSARLMSIQQVKAYAVALGQETDQVARLWIKAKEAMDRAADAAREAQAPQITSWAELPQADLSLKTLMEAQARAVERLPYDLLGVEEPPLSAVYVRQQVRPPRDGTPDAHEHRGSERSRTDPTHIAEPTALDETRMPLPHALARHTHLLITGEPGAGKSTMTSHLAWSLARIWLRRDSSSSAPLTEPVVPLRIAAYTLVTDAAPWSSMLERALRLSLGSSLIADPPPWLFQGRVQGARWLVLIDGLDEITDQDARRTVIKAIAQHARRGSDYRFVITSRPLPTTELSLLRTTALGEYTLEPFGPAELGEFADKWFHAQFTDEEEALAAAAQFLKETEDRRLRDVVRNPLLATIAAVNATISPDRPLPANRVSLYQRFFSRLLNQNEGAGATREVLHRRLQNDPARRDFLLWLGRNKHAVLQALGRHRVESERPLLEAAVDWVKDNPSQLVQHLPRWKDDIPEFLRSTGLLVSGEAGFRFLHHSFAEYFAAEAYVESLGADFPELEAWLCRAMFEEDPTLAVFTLCLWAERPSHDPDLVVDTLLTGNTGGHRRPLLAGLLLAEGVRFGEEQTRRAVERLENIATFTWDTESRDRAFEVMGSLGQIPEVVKWLETFAASTLVASNRRLLAVRSFSRVGSRASTENLLIDVLGDVDEWLDKAAEIASGLGLRAKEAVRCRALEMAESASEYPSTIGAAAKALALLGASDDAKSIARAGLTDHTLANDTVRQLTEAWLSVTPAHEMTAVTEEIVELVVDRPGCDWFCHMAAGQELEKAGEIKAAAVIARRILGSPAVWPAPLKWAAAVISKASKEGARAEIEAALEHCTPDGGHYPWTLGTLHSALVDLGVVEKSATWARETLSAPHGSLIYANEYISTWLDAEGLEAVEAIMEKTCRGNALLSYGRAKTAEALSEAGARDEALEVAELALRTPNGSREEYSTAAGLVLKYRGSEGAGRLLEIWETHPMLAMNDYWLRGAVDAIGECQDDRSRVMQAAARFGYLLVELPLGTGDSAVAGLRLLLSANGSEAVPFAIAAVQKRSWLSWDSIREIADECAALGTRQAAMTIWRHILEGQSYPDRHLLNGLALANAHSDAIAWIEALLDTGSLSPARQDYCRRLLAALTYEGPPATSA
ncbi:NACHT domain-containing protein [Streptomyces sp. NPDC001275]